MDRRRFFLAALLFVFAATLSPAQNPAPTPPMGWNSWDAYGLTIDEADFRANATVLAGVRQYGWQYAVIDEGWYMENPFGAIWPKEVSAGRKRDPDSGGEPLPFVGGGAGFKPLADWVHAQGLKFGIHIVRGIPRAGGEGESAHRRVELSCGGRRRQDFALPMGRGQLGRGRQRRRAGLLRFDAEALCRLGTGLHQGGLHQRSPLPAHRDSRRLPRRSRRPDGRSC